MNRHRDEEILRYLEAHEVLTTEQALSLFGGSPATIRRAFARLAGSQSVRRVHGGVRRILAQGPREAFPFSMRQRWYADEKARLAERAMEFAPKNGAMFIHSGSTTLALAETISQGTVITNSINICERLMHRFPSEGGPEIILPGGSFNLRSGVISGPRTESMIREYRAETAFFSARGMDDQGLLDSGDELASIARLMIENADCSVMLADHSKFRTFGLVRMVPWKLVNILITTDHAENHPWFERIQKHGVTIITVPPLAPPLSNGGQMG